MNLGELDFLSEETMTKVVCEFGHEVRKTVALMRPAERVAFYNELLGYYCLKCGQPVANCSCHKTTPAK